MNWTKKIILNQFLYGDIPDHDEKKIGQNSEPQNHMFTSISVCLWWAVCYRPTMFVNMFIKTWEGLMSASHARSI